MTGYDATPIQVGGQYLIEARQTEQSGIGSQGRRSSLDPKTTDQTSLIWWSRPKGATYRCDAIIPDVVVVGRKVHEPLADLITEP